MLVYKSAKFRLEKQRGNKYLLIFNHGHKPIYIFGKNAHTISNLLNNKTELERFLKKQNPQ